MALAPTINEILPTHKNILGRIDEIMEFCDSAIYRDQFLEFEEFTEVKRLLDGSKVLLCRINIGERFEDYNRSKGWYTLEFFTHNTRDAILKYWT
jgi:hypothetical protein